MHMWMSELSQRSGVPVPTIKYYLREGLLLPGEAVRATRAIYDETHVSRLRLIRALVGVGGMSLARVRRVLETVDDEANDLHQVLAAAHEQLSPESSAEPSAESREQVAKLIRKRRWRVSPNGRHVTALAGALDDLAASGMPMPGEALATYADAAALVAGVDLAGMPGGTSDGSREGAATYAVTGTVLAAPVLLALRRLAHENLSTRRFTRRRRATAGAPAGRSR